MFIMQKKCIHSSANINLTEVNFVHIFQTKIFCLQLYDQWEKDRVHLYLELLEQRDRERRLAEVNNKLRELEEKEEELYYFQMKDKMEIQMEEKLKEIRKREEKLQAIRKAEAEEYIPPEMPRTIGTPNEAPKQLT